MSAQEQSGASLCTKGASQIGPGIEGLEHVPCPPGSLKMTPIPTMWMHSALLSQSQI